jgi:DNA-binding transcriptional MocR family regulator
MQENRMLAQNLSPELQEAIKSGALKPEHLKEISQALSQNRSASDRKLSKLNQKRLIDSKPGAAAERRDNSGLARFLQENAQRMSVEDAVEAWCEKPGRGGISRGRGDAAMTWTDGTSEKNAKFKERELPPSFAAGLKDSQLVGLSASEPAIQKTLAAHGALIDAAKGGGSAHTATILPRHKGAVKRYFDRK